MFESIIRPMEYVFHEWKWGEAQVVNINNKPWDKLRFRDIEKFLSEADDENFFFEFKSDDEEPK